jgi:hypothetical protein
MLARIGVKVNLLRAQGAVFCKVEARRLPDLVVLLG